jgi:hypothetical protein
MITHTILCSSLHCSLHRLLCDDAHNSGCVTGEKELDLQSVSVAVVGADQGFEMVEGERMQAYLDAVEVCVIVQDG